MIDFIRGTLARKLPKTAVVDVSGVGFEMSIPAGTYDRLGEPGEKVTLLTRLIHRDDTMELCGFGTDLERQVYDKLIGASGIGPTMAMKILSGMEAADLAAAIEARDYKLLTSIPGLGKKRAERLCVELKDSLSDLSFEKTASAAGSTAETDAIEALTALGFGRPEAVRAVRKVASELSSPTPDEIIRKSISRLKED